ncbi:redox-sensitive transcriptional activator SoxR [Nocardioides sp. KIGAM211]|uniref:Redox-sensitive transcriptional activator SoxR n=1 Tax=Nocardioides luti TaxID=2761101 RepID=A0A7X0RHV5_9ACTN|nr:redox-sensitive transcriptional activator SoxR [Nocardioides luti]MBB6628608.1 redox-sensitive transcriptional activator SoxR [Nocardioides luti]
MSALTIGHLAERAGVATSAIRFYESRGLLASERTSGNQRRYPQAALRRVAFIRTAQQVGLSLDEIADALATLPADHAPTKADWTRLSRAWRPRLDEQIERLERLRDTLDGCIGCGCLSLRTCALTNPDDEVAARGRGAVLLEPGATTAPPSGTPAPDHPRSPR